MTTTTDKLRAALVEAPAAQNREREDELGQAAVAFVNSYQDHIGRCRACDLAWKNLREVIQKVNHG